MKAPFEKYIEEHMVDDEELRKDLHSLIEDSNGTRVLTTHAALMCSYLRGGAYLICTDRTDEIIEEVSDLMEAAANMIANLCYGRETK